MAGEQAKGPSNAARFGMSAVLTTVGIAHFVAPEGFDAIIPDELPAPRLLTYASGAAEIGLGAALALRPSRRLGWLIVALLVAVFPANVNQAMRGIQLPGAPELPRAAMWARLPFQALLIWAALAATRPVPTAGASVAESE